MIRIALFLCNLQNAAARAGNFVGCATKIYRRAGKNAGKDFCGQRGEGKFLEKIVRPRNCRRETFAWNTATRCAEKLSTTSADDRDESSPFAWDR